MRESPFGFHYSWQDLQPVRPLFVTVLLAQMIGAGICLLIAPLPQWFDNLWMGGALCTFPGYLIGLPIQIRIRRRSVEENKVMVRRMGYIAFALTVAAIVLPRVELIHAL